MIIGQSFPPSNDLHRLSSGGEDDYRYGSADEHNEGEEVNDVWDHKTSVKFQDLGDEDEDLDREVSIVYYLTVSFGRGPLFYIILKFILLDQFYRIEITGYIAA